ncbi:hypothetical protein NL676_029395 [Syzygium grande]|nr:hypothetical protein NL676_029395 [Syzygium grande]
MARSALAMAGRGPASSPARRELAQIRRSRPPPHAMMSSPDLAASPSPGTQELARHGRREAALPPGQARSSPPLTPSRAKTGRSLPHARTRPGPWGAMVAWGGWGPEGAGGSPPWLLGREPTPGHGLSCRPWPSLSHKTGGEGGLGKKPSPVEEATLHRVATSLQMYVDELPQMPKFFGYALNTGSPEPEIPPRFTCNNCICLRNVGSNRHSARPTIEVIRGVSTCVTWENHLPQSHVLPWDPTIPNATPKHGGVPTVVYLHGGVHPPKLDGSALAWFTSDFKETGSAWSRSTYTYPNVQQSGNLWYHDHALGLTRVNILAGLIAAYVLRDPAFDVKMNLPVGPEFDRHLMIFDRSFYKDRSLYLNYTGNNPTIHPRWRPEYFGEAILANGKVWPYLQVQRTKYRFRIINVSNARYYSLALTNGLSFTVVGSDSSYLASPVTTQRILLSPAETFDVVVDFCTATATESILTNNAPYPYSTGTQPDQLMGQAMKFIIKPGAPSPPDTSRVPASLAPSQAATIVGASLTRYITLYEYLSSANLPTHLYINVKSFHDPVTETPKSGSIEVWEVINLTGDNHPLHVHLATFQAIKVQHLVDEQGFLNCITSKNDAVACNVTGHATGPTLDIPAHERAWKNISKIEPGYKTTVDVRFNLVEENNAPYPFDVTSAPGYVYHCHILDHEDNEMIRPLKLVK